jgi:hypothetical protein
MICLGTFKSGFRSWVAYLKDNIIMICHKTYFFMAIGGLFCVKTWLDILYVNEAQRRS